MAYQFFGNFADNVRVVQSSPIIRPNRADMHARLVVPIGQKVVNFIVGHGLAWACGTLPRSCI